MMIGRMRRTLKRSLSIAMAAALMVTSVPQLAVAAAAQEEVQTENPSEEAASGQEEESQSGESKNKESEDQESMDEKSTDEADESTAGVDKNSDERMTKVDKEDNEESAAKDGKEDSDETQQTSTEQADREEVSETENVSDEEKTSEIESESETETAAEKKDELEQESETEEEEKKVQDVENADDIEGKLIYKNNFDDVAEGTALANGKVVELADGNMAVEYDVDLSESSKWVDIFQAGFDLTPSYDEVIKEKLTLSYDVYFPDSVEDFKTIKAKAVLKVGDSWKWTEGNELPEYTAESLKPGEIDGYNKLHVTLDLSSQTGWNIEDIISIKSVIPCLAGDVSDYKGKLYLDNVILADTSTFSGGDEPDNPSNPEEIEGKLIYKNDFDDVAEGTALANGKVVELADGNMAIEYDVDLSESSKWVDIFQAGFDLTPSYDEVIKEKLTLSYDVYFPDSVEDFKTIKAKAVLKVGDNWKWTEGNELPEYTAESLKPGGINGYNKLHVTLDLSSQTGWNIEDITSIKSVIPCLAGDVSDYKGKLYLDNVVLTDTSTISGEDKPNDNEEIIYQNNFDTESNESIVEEADGKKAELATLADGNKAIKFTTDLSASTGWSDIFKAQINLPEEYAKTISGKVVMSYDVYFPESSITNEFGTIKAQAALKSGADWTWITQKSWPSAEAADLEESGISGYKVFHVEIDMNDFQTWDGEKNVDYPFAAITPIKTVIPCLAGDVSGYAGDVYLDNLVVKAVNESGDIPPVEGDLALDLGTSSWSVSEGYQYTGKSTITNDTVGDKNFLVFNMDYSNNSDKNWSEAKFEYTHPETIADLQGYNAFKADIYYKPADMTTGSFGIKLFSSSPKIDKDAAVPAGEPADIQGLEGYYKAEYVLDLRIPSGAFQNLTFGFVGKNTDFKGDIYLDNMRFTQVIAEDIYVDSTETPVKGEGIQVVDGGRSIQTASGNKVAIAEEVALADANANEATKNLYAYLKAVGESDSVIFGHQNDTHHKAGSAGDGFSNSDTKDITGSIAGVIGIDALSLTGNEASTWDAPEADRIAKVAAITREAAAEGALVTLSAHMPNFDVIDKRVKAYEESGGTGTDSDSVGYWDVDGDRQYNFSGYTPGTLTGNVVARVMPGQDLNYLYTDYLDLIADYAKAVENDGITILFRPLHENTGSWFWWGAALCDEQAYIALYRYTVNYLKETKDVHNMLYVYGPGSEAANVAEYSARYPGDAYVDMIGYDLYHQVPSPENEAGYLQSIRKQNTILQEFAAEHNKLYAITETGVADKNASGEDVALQRTGNKVMDWYMQLLDEISDAGVCYFLVWANFSENGSFYLPYVVEKKENGVLHGHEMMDEFIRFYNDGRSVFATDMNSGFAQISGVTNTTKEGAAAGYIIAPQSGERILAGGQATRIAAAVSGDVSEAAVQFIAAAGDKQVVLDAELNQQENIWEAFLTDEDLVSLGEIPGTIALFVNNKEIAVINARFNLAEPVQDDMVPEDFESYAGSNRELNSAWPGNKDSGSEVALVLTEEKDKVFGGKYGMQMNITLAKSDAWVGATKSFEADWSQGNALELYTIPEPKGQKVVVQVKSAGEEFEVYLQEYEAYTNNAATGTPVKVTIPFSAFVGKNNGKFDPGKIEVIGLWCNAIAKEGLEFPLSTTICYDEMRVVTTDQTEVQIEPLKDNGSGDNDDNNDNNNNDNNNNETNNVTGYITAPVSGDVLLPSAQGQGTRIAAKVSNVDVRTSDVQFVIIAASREERLKAAYNEGKDEWETVLEDSVLESLGEGSGTIRLFADGKELAAINVKFGRTEQDDIIVKKGIWVKPIPTQAYTGKAVKPQVVVYDDAKLLTQNKDYTVSYKNNVNAGTAAKVIIKGKGNYTETIETAFTIIPKQITKEMVTYPDYLAYNNKDQKINVTIKDGNKKLSSTKNYTQTITYNGASVTKARAAGTYQIKISGIGNYSGVLTLNCEMVTDKQLLGKASVKLPASFLNCDEKGAGVTFDETKISVKLGNKTIPQKEADGVVNYTIRYENNQKPGTATVIIEAGAGSKYVGSCRKNFNIKGKKFSAGTINITGLQTKIAYTGETRLQQLTLTDRSSNKRLQKDVDYRVTYQNNLNAGKAAVILTGCGSYSGTIKKTYTISRINLTADMIKSRIVQTEQSRAGAAPDITLTYMGKTLVRDRDYTLSYTNNTHITTNAKKAYISVTGKGNYAGKLNKAVELQIVPKSWQSDDITIEIPDMKYAQNKKEYKPNPVVCDNGKKLVKGKDYTVTYESNTRQDAANMTAEGHVARAVITVISPDYADGTENDRRIAEFRIINKLISQAKVEFVNPQYFSQLGVKPDKKDLRVTYQGTTVSEDEYDIISYSEHTNKGKAELVLKGRKQYGGTKKVTYTIKAKGMHSNVAKAFLKMAQVLQ